MNATDYNWSLADLVGDSIENEIESDVLVSGLQSDSRSVKAGDIFVALKGLHHHGLEYVEAAHKQGAVAVLYDEPETKNIPECDLPLIKVNGLRGRLGTLADRFFGSPSSRLKIVGVTGTNGKTSVCQYLTQALNQVAGPCGFIGTTGAGVGDQFKPATNTTPDVISVHALLAEFEQLGASHVAMEVSSHALDQGRIDGVIIDVAVFTNLTRDHLDYHESMDNYADAKQQLLSQPGVRCVVINVDDAEGREWLNITPDGLRAITCSVDGKIFSDEYLLTEKVSYSRNGIEMKVVSRSEKVSLNTNLLGQFNSENLLLATGALMGLGITLKKACQLLSSVKAAPGRMERFGVKNQPLVVVDYAHTPDALEKALSSLKSHCAGDLICVFGCGGDRDQGKRPLMGKIAERLADRIYVTDDNPRNENPVDITTQIIKGMTSENHAVVLHDRYDAIQTAINSSAPRDCVLIAGKGHETDQITGSIRREFSDRNVVKHVLRGYSG